MDILHYVSVQKPSNQVQNYLSFKPDATIATMHCYKAVLYTYKKNVYIKSTKHIHIMSLEDEILMWVYFWCGSAFIFLLLWCIINFKNNKK